MIRRYFPGFWGTLLDILLVIVVVLAVFHNPTGSADWVQQRAHNVADIVHQATIFVQHL